MFHRYGKKIKTGQMKSITDLTRVHQPYVLLSDEKRKNLLEQIKENNSLEEARYDSLCLHLITNLINHCQLLPETSNSYYSQPGGMLDHALNRTDAALSLFKQFALQDANSALTEEQKLWQYTLFSAALLQGIGKLQIDFVVEIYDGNAQFLKQWNPLLENLLAFGSHYRYEFQKESDPDFRKRLNLLLARLLMPLGGFTWIASHPHVLSIWLALLNEDYTAAGTLGAILIRANAISIQRYFNQMLLRAYGSRGKHFGRAGTFSGINTDKIAEIEQQMGVEFINWLVKELDAGRIMVNKAPLFMVPGGLLMCADMFKLFVREHPEFKNWQAVRNGVLSLGFHKLGSDGNVVTRFEQTNTHEMHEGIVIEDYAIVLPERVQYHQLATDKTTSISALELIHQAQFNNSFLEQKVPFIPTDLQRLNVKGEWEVTPPSAPINLKPGIPHSA